VLLRAGARIVRAEPCGEVLMGQPFADWPPDDKILSLFRDWIVAQNDADALGQLNPSCA
jgi:hypothetical protein